MALTYPHARTANDPTGVHLTLYSANLTRVLVEEEHVRADVRG